METFEKMQLARKNFMEQFENNYVLSKEIPKIAAELIYYTFDINITDAYNSVIPLVWTEGWKHIIDYMGSQQTDEFAIDVFGISVEYVTEFSETDKSRNIVPQLIHKQAPVFVEGDKSTDPAFKQHGQMVEKYNRWRTVNLQETITKVENDVRDAMLNQFGIDLTDPVAVFPFMAATYAAGLAIAKDTKKTVNMYNVFEIDIMDGDKIVLTPLNVIKHGFKNDDSRD